MWKKMITENEFEQACKFAEGRFSKDEDKLICKLGDKEISKVGNKLGIKGITLVTEKARRMSGGIYHGKRMIEINIEDKEIKIPKKGPITREIGWLDYFK